MDLKIIKNYPSIELIAMVIIVQKIVSGLMLLLKEEIQEET